METLNILTSDSGFGIYRICLSKIPAAQKTQFINECKTIRSNKEAMRIKAAEYFDLKINLAQAWLDRIAYIESEFEKEQLSIGVMTHLGFKMKSGFEDATILKEAATFLQSLGQTEMTLKDVNGLLHKNIALADVIQISNTIGLNYLQIWNKRELLKEQIRNTSDSSDLAYITW